MNDQILKSLCDHNQAQARKLVAHFKKIFPNCEGRQYSQIITCLNAVYRKEHSDNELKKIITDGNGDGGLADAIVFRKDSFDIFEFKEGANLGLREVQQFRERLDTLVFPLNTSDFSYSDNDISRIKHHLKKIHSLENKRSGCNVYFVRNSFGVLNESIKKEIQKIEKNPGVKIHLLDNEKIINLLLDKDFLKEWSIRKSSVDVLKKQEINDSTKEYDFLILNISLSDLLKLYKVHIKEKKDLFDRNIRVPKKAEKFSNGIFRTIDESSRNFFLFHNGITITADGIGANATCFIVSEPQVINGAQTLGNLYEKYQNNLDDKKLSESKVLCKIIKADQDLTDLICETSNTQKAVKVEDLRTNDSFQKKLEIYIKTESRGKYRYDRKSKKAERGSIGIRYTKFFQWAYSAFLFDPANAKNAKQSLFEKDDRGEYENIKKEIEKDLSKIIFLCEVGLFVEQYIKQQNNKTKISLLKSADLHIIAGLFLLRSKEISNLNKIYRLLKDYSGAQIKKDKSLNNNKIFTKSNDAWRFLKAKLKVYY